MAITVTYNPSLSAGGQLAYEAGRGRFLQDKDRFDYERLLRDRQFDESQRQFDEQLGFRQDQLAQQNQQFNQNLSLQAQLAQLRNQQFNRQLAQQSYQYDASLAQRGQLAEAEMTLAGQREQRLSDWMQLQDEQQRQAIAARERAAARGDLAGIRKQQEQQRYGLAMQELNRLEEARAEGLPVDQYEQAKGQWVAKYGDIPAIGGVYPADMPAEPRSPEFALEMQQQRFAEWGEYQGDQLFTPNEMFAYGVMDGDEFQFTEEGLKRFSQDKNKRIDDRYRREKDRDALEHARELKVLELELKQREYEAKQEGERKDTWNDSTQQLSKYRAAMAKFRQSDGLDDRPSLAEFLPMPATMADIYFLPPGSLFLNRKKDGTLEVYRKIGPNHQQKVDVFDYEPEGI